MRKLANLQFNNPVKVDASADNPDVLLIGVGSTLGTISEAKGRLEKEGYSVNHAQVRLIHPFPSEALEPYVQAAKKVIVIENNATGQLADMVKLHVGYREKIESMLKYDGNPFLPYEIHQKVKELI
jgi:2-oxoglutarate ferredoxin oxidoreductase subunit alpha